MVGKLSNQMVWDVVKTIPAGKVLTYGDIAQILKKPRASRYVGWALHANTFSDIPCHRVVDRTGRVAPNFAGPHALSAQANGRRAFDSSELQRRLLESEGVEFVDEMHVDLAKHLWQASNLK